MSEHREEPGSGRPQEPATPETGPPRLTDAATDEAVINEAGIDAAGSDETAVDVAGTDEAGMDEAGMDEAGMDEAGTDETAGATASEAPPADTNPQPSAADTNAGASPAHTPPPGADTPSGRASPPPPPPSRRSSLPLLAALVLAIIAAVAAVYAGLQSNSARSVLSLAEAEQAEALQRQRNEITNLETALSALRADLAAADDERREAIEQLDRRLEPWSGRFSEIERRVDAIAGGSLDTRASWMRAEAEYYLVLANTELGLAGRWDNAIEALRLADERLAGLSDPAYSNVRLQIAEELLALAGVERPDIEGMAFTLAGLSRSAAQLPLRVGPASNYTDDPPALEETPAGFGRFWQGVKDSLSGIVRVQRRDAPVVPVLSAEEGRLARRQLLVELELARVALIGAQQGTFSSSLQTARQILEADFDRADARVRAAIATLGELAGARLAAEVPDISGSLAALRRLDRAGE